MDIAFVGVGYVGLVSGIMMSYLGHNVTCLDTDVAKIKQLNAGILPIYEPGLEEYFKEAVRSGKLHFSNQYSDIEFAPAIFITVGTPSLPSGEADISYVLSVIKDIGQTLWQGKVIVIKSTVPPGTCLNISNELKNQPYHIVSNPEFLREGCAVQDFLTPDRIIIGIDDATIPNGFQFLKDEWYTKQILAEIYKPLSMYNIPFVWTDLTTAELIKCASNSFLATKIAFINEMANICEKIDADIEMLSLGMGYDHRIGKEFLRAGPGFGGSCFPKDILALSQLAKTYDIDCLIMNATILANNNRSDDMVKKVCNIMGGKISGLNFAVFGLAFKAGTDDIRHSPAIEIIQLLQANGAVIRAYDPQVSQTQLKRHCEETSWSTKQSRDILGGDQNNISGSPRPLKWHHNDLWIDIECTNSIYDACAGADAIIVATEWPEFKELDFDIIYQQLKTPIIIDLRNILDAAMLRKKGFSYYSVGQKHE